LLCAGVLPRRLLSTLFEKRPKKGPEVCLPGFVEAGGKG
jgi:hypothetical protein